MVYSTLKTGCLSWGVVSISYLLAYLHRTSVGTVNDEICSEFGLSSTTFGIMASMYFYAYMIMQIPAGLLADSWSPRKTVTVGVLVGGAATLLFGFAANPVMLSVGRFFIGAGMATVFVSLLKIQSQWFSGKMFATLSGFSIFIGNIGGVLGQFPFAVSTLSIGWRNSYLIVALITIALGIICFFVVKDKPENAGLPPLYGLVEGVKVVLRETRLYGAAAFYLFNQGAFLAFTGAWLVPWLREVYKMNSAVAANLGTFAIVGGMAGSSLSGILSDKLKIRKPVIMTGSILCSCVWGLLAIWRTDNYFVISSLFFALGTVSGVFPISMAIAKEVSPAPLTGTAIAVLNTLGFLSVASTTSLLGFIADLGENLTQTERFDNVLIACFVLSVMSSFASFFCYETHARNVNPVTSPEHK